ncbi:hypothetical protein WJX73_001697 [Symbiochloris irregularis]|uniref:Uncharacterized protein n=1 Tax=Symbiochloris irregularis TaxID=706552 RepID=A0AAW1PY32_9CHLO
MEEAQALVAGLIETSRSFVAGVNSLRGPLETEVYEASDACWTFNNREVEVKPKFGFRSKHYKVSEAVYVANPEQLDHALARWQSTAEGTVASTALDVSISSWRLLFFLSRYMQGSDKGNGSILLQLLDLLLTAVGQMGAPIIISCPSTFHTFKGLALLLGEQYKTTVPQQTGSQAVLQLLMRHVQHVDWAAALMQPSLEDLPTLLPVLAEEASKVAAGMGNSDEVAGVLFKVVATLCTDEKTSCGDGMIEILLVSLLALSQGGDLQTLQGTGEGSQGHTGTGDSSSEAGMSIGAWAELVWGMKHTPGTPVAAVAAQALPWEDILPLLSGRWRLRVLLTLLALANGSLAGFAGEGESPFVIWLWQQLQGHLGSLVIPMTQRDPDQIATFAEADMITADEATKEAWMQEAHLLCMAQVGEASGRRQALWAWLQIRLALAQLQHWAASNDQGAAEQAGVLLDAMQFFTLPDRLLTQQHPEPLGEMIVTLVTLASQLGPAFKRAHRQAMSRLLAACLLSAPPAAQESFFTSIRASVKKCVAEGIAQANRDSPTKAQEATTAPVPSTRKSYHHPTKRGSTMSPGPTALAFAADWLALLTPAMAWAPFPVPGLALVGELTQLLFYHSPRGLVGEISGVDVGLVDAPASAEDVFPLPIMIKDCVQAIAASLNPATIQSVWHALMKSQDMEGPKPLLWLPLLACWLSHRNDGGKHRTPAADGDASRPHADGHRDEPDEAARGDDSPRAGDSSPEDSSPMDQKAEEAIIIQETAIRTGYGGASLPLWEEFCWRYFRWQARLENVVPNDTISSHLVQLSHFYEATSPTLSNLCALVAPLSPDTLPGDTACFVTRNTEAMQALMQLHPLALASLDKVPRAESSPTHTPHSTASDADISSVLKRKQPVVVSAFQDVLDQQSSIANQARMLRAQPSFNAGAAAVRSSDGGTPAVRSSEGGTEPAALSRTLSKKSSMGAADPFAELVSEPMASISNAMGKWSEALQMNQAQLQEIVARRYTVLTVSQADAERIEDGGEIKSQERDDYMMAFQMSRQLARQLVTDFVQGPAMHPVTQHLFLMDTALSDLGLTATDTGKGKGKAQAPRHGEQRALLRAIVEVILDGSAPAVCLPFLNQLFQRSCPTLLHKSPAAQEDMVELMPQVMMENGQSDLALRCIRSIMAVALSLSGPTSRAAAMEPVMVVGGESITLEAALEAVKLVTEALNEGSIVTEVPFQLVGKLLSLPCLMTLLQQRQQPASRASTADPSLQWPTSPAPGSEADTADVKCWSAEISRALESNTGTSAPGGQVSVMCLPVHAAVMKSDPVVPMLDACLQSILRRFGNGLNGASLREAFTQLITLVLDPAAAQPPLVDWLWTLLPSVLQPFLALAEPVSDGQLVRSFRECWACAPWGQATFHARNPGTLALLRGRLFNSDHAVLEMLPGLNWQLVDQKLPQAATADSAEATGDSSSEVQAQWAAETALLGLQLCVLRSAESLPDWWHQLIWTSGAAHTNARLVTLLAAADLPTIQQSLLSTGDAHVPFLLQGLVTAPQLVQGALSSRVLHAAELLTQSAAQRNEPEYTACVAQCLASLPLTSLLQTRASDADEQHGDNSDAGHVNKQGAADACWQLTADEQSQLLSSCLIPLARQHSSIPLAASTALEKPALPLSLSASPSRWQPPNRQLSQLAEKAMSQALSMDDNSSNSSGSPFSFARGSFQESRPSFQESSRSDAAEEAAPGSLTAADVKKLHEASALFSLVGCLKSKPSTIPSSEPMSFASRSIPIHPPASSPLAEGMGMREHLTPQRLDPIDSPALLSFQEHAASLMQLQLSAPSANASPKAIAPADTPPPDTSILALSLRAFEGLSDEGVAGLARESAATGQLITLILVQEHLRRRLLKQAHARWWQHATAALNLGIRTTAPPSNPAMLVALWLSLLPWVDDPRWLGKGQRHADLMTHQHPGGPNESSVKVGIEPVEEVLEVLQEHVLRLFESQMTEPEVQAEVDGKSSSSGQQPAGPVQQSEPSVTGKLKGVLKTVATSRSAISSDGPETPPSPSEPFSLNDLGASEAEKRDSTWGGLKRMLSQKASTFQVASLASDVHHPSGPELGGALGAFGNHYPHDMGASSLHGLQGETPSSPFAPAARPEPEKRSPSPPQRRWGGFKSLLSIKERPSERPQQQHTTPQGVTITSLPSGFGSGFEAYGGTAPATSGPIMQPAPSFMGAPKPSFAQGFRRAFSRMSHAPPHDSHPPSKPSTPNASQHGSPLADRKAESDTIVRQGLAAFAIAAYVKAILCPSLANYIPRSSSGFAHLANWSRQSRDGQRHSHSSGLPLRKTASTMQHPTHSKAEEQMMLELDGGGGWVSVMTMSGKALDTVSRLKCGQRMWLALAYILLEAARVTQIPLLDQANELEGVVPDISPLRGCTGTAEAQWWSK